MEKNKNIIWDLESDSEDMYIEVFGVLDGISENEYINKYYFYPIRKSPKRIRKDVSKAKQRIENFINKCWEGIHGQDI